ncbi:hypothetical protein [Streptomyces soliscabiei]|uniref:hypothetical protein n=1 Tax=Streptomyces soliscabiei TaxID=588897 RepID=UPI0029BB2B5D|nr:hypothetical protein [Streptomyces sp. NY05-11A]MDX2683068.1 hypothetical protein [Streptomyces sp. NY05-11A]
MPHAQVIFHERGTHQGIPAMAERLAQVGGRLSVGRSEDGGATVQAWATEPPQ